MNIWALKKDTSIKHLLLLLAHQFEDGCYEIIDSSLDDQRAVRLANPAASAAQLYVFTYGQNEGCYGVDVEYPDLRENNYSDTIESHENVSFDSLVNIIKTVLEIPVEKLNPTFC
jgi:hypothetical protein